MSTNKIIAPQIEEFGLRSYDTTPLSGLGYIEVKIEEKKIQAQHILFVVQNGSNLGIGRNWLIVFGMWPLNFAKSDNSKINAINKNDEMEVEKVCEEYYNVFEPGISKFTKGELTLKLKVDTKLVFRQTRHPAIALRPRIEFEIERLKSLQILSPIEYSE
ncbi:uncharacterized protein LOC117173688 [Belonocnema kinseyi]|uniref:uncharacterized protein LOC117173688 n=1 Tax=Belonocnema kinseyi TaxID=2817044 RepID=UPI00143D9A3F|nr:uncharacterized protein LOC117173688 [Belonocnema kinseyi]